MKSKRSYVGETYVTSQGEIVEIIESNGSMDITVRFPNGYILKTNLSNCKKGYIKNPYYPSVMGVGYMGVGKYGTKDKKIYSCWYDMLNRCYGDREMDRSYQDTNTHPIDEWLNFQNFADWYVRNEYYCEEPLHLDKDILDKHSKLYSPDTCLLLPATINTLFIKQTYQRGNCCMGVTKERNGSYRAQCSVKGETYCIGCYQTELDAFYAYKEFKENLIKQIANEYKDIIPRDTYNALLEYEIELDD